MRILVVDDDPRILALVRELLIGEGYEVTTACDGACALQSAAQSPPDLILVDLRMPIMDGREFTRTYRAQPGPHAPIIAVTATGEADTMASIIEADGWLTKPYDLDCLLALVRRYEQGEEPS